MRRTKKRYGCNLSVHDQNCVHKLYHLLHPLLHLPLPLLLLLLLLRWRRKDFRNRSHYCNGKCRLQNKNRSAEFMLRCEACDERFHGKCRGVKEGVIDDEQVWVCSESCFEQLPLRQCKRDVVVNRPKQKHKKRETKEKTLHDDASNKKRSSYNTKAKQQLQLTGQMDRF